MSILTAEHGEGVSHHRPTVCRSQVTLQGRQEIPSGLPRDQVSKSRSLEPTLVWDKDGPSGRLAMTHFIFSLLLQGYKVMLVGALQ